MAKELKRKEEEDRIMEALDKEAAQNEPMDLDPPGSTSETMTSGHIPFGEVGLTPFTPSKKHTMSHLDTIIFDKSRNIIIRRSDKILNHGHIRQRSHHH